METNETVTPAAGSETAAKASIADEFLAAFKATETPKVGVGTETATKTEVEAKTEGEKVEAKEEGSEETAETVTEPKTTEKPTSLARRLALVAQAETRRKAQEAADAKAKADQEARDKEIAPIIERITKAKSAKSRMEAAATVLGLDEDGIAELYLELHKHHAEGGEKKTEDPLANLEQTVAKLLDAKLKERDESQKASNEAALNAQREAYTAEALGVLEARGDEFPLVAISPPSQVDITAISEAWLVANGEIPEPEAVLKMIQDRRQKDLDERAARAKAKAAPTGSEKKTEVTTATGKAGETSGSKTSTKRDDVALTPPRKMSIAEEFTEAYRATAGTA